MKKRIFGSVKIISGNLSLVLILPKEIGEICDLKKSDLMICLTDGERIILEKNEIDKTQLSNSLTEFGD